MSTDMQSGILIREARDWAKEDNADIVSQEFILGLADALEAAEDSHESACTDVQGQLNGLRMYLDRTLDNIENETRGWSIADVRAFITEALGLDVEPATESPTTVEWGVRATGGSTHVYETDTEEDAREWVAGAMVDRALPREVVSRTAAGPWEVAK